jgi:hypothetical protein
MKLVILLTACSTAPGMEPDGRKNLVLELPDVLITHKSAHEVVQKLGFGSIVLGALGGSDVAHPAKELFGLMQQPAPADQLHWNGVIAPQIVNDWIMGVKPCEQLLPQAFSEIDEKCSSWTARMRKPFYHHLATCILDPKANTAIMQPIPGIHETLTQATSRGYTLWLLAHWNNESLELLIKEYPALFNHFEKRIYASSTAKTVKPKELYPKFLEAKGLELGSCCFVETDTHCAARLETYAKELNQEKPEILMLQPEQPTHNLAALQQHLTLKD